jgi:hypothetical protein
VSVPVGQELKSANIAVLPARDASFWGPRVAAYCSSAQIALFQ